MRTLSWLGRVSLVPAVGMGLLIWWVAAALGRNGYDMSSWAVLLLFGGLALSRSTPRVAIVAFDGAFALQFARAVCRFDQEGWLAYAAIPLAAIVYGAMTSARRRRALGVLLSLGLLTGLFTNVPALGRIDYFSNPGQTISPGAYWGFIDGVGIVNGKTWPPASAFGLAEIVLGTIVWSAGAMLLVVAGWSIGSGYRARRLQWAAEARSDADRAALAVSNADLRLVEQRDRIAQDVHAITAHRLSVILAQADGAAAHASDPDTRVTLATISGSARSALAEIRTLLENLDDATDGDTARGVTDVRSLIAAASSEGVPVTLEEHGVAKPLSSSAGLAAYRIAQEALANAMRHAPWQRRCDPHHPRLARRRPRALRRVLAEGGRSTDRGHDRTRPARHERTRPIRRRLAHRSWRRHRLHRHSPCPDSRDAGRVIEVLVVDDQPLFCAGIARILDAEQDLRCVGVAHNGQEAIAAAERLTPAVVLMDLRMPVLNGVEATRRITRLPSGPRVLVLTTFRDRSIVRDATSAGAIGFVTKDATPEHLCRAIRAVATGSSVFADARKPMLPDPTPGPDLAAIEVLSPREQQVYLHLARGLSNSEIGRRTHLTENTVRTHVSAILRKLTLTRRAQVVDHAHRNGLTPDTTT